MINKRFKLFKFSEWIIYLPGNIDIPLVICIFSFMETKMLSNVPRLLLLLLFWLFSFFLFSLLLLLAMFITICNNKTTPRDVSQIRERERFWKHISTCQSCENTIHRCSLISPIQELAFTNIEHGEYLLATREPRVQPWFFWKMRWRIGNS